MKYKVGDLLGTKTKHDDLWLVQNVTKEKITLLSLRNSETWTDLVCNVEEYKNLKKIN